MGQKAEALPAQCTDAEGKILVIDDDEHLTELIRLALRRLGYTIFCATGGEEGLTLFREIRPDLVTLDVLMPGMDGWEVCRRLRSISSVPIIFLTVLNGEEDVVRALDTVGLTELANRTVGSLSGGQFQRALFARLLLQDAAVILLDEPFRAVDTPTVEHLLQLIQHWHREGRTVLAALHDIEQVRAHFPRTLLLAREVVAWGNTAGVLSRENLVKSRKLAFDAHPDVCERDKTLQREAV